MSSAGNDNSFKNKRALVTGGSRGIGIEIVRALYVRGAHVIASGSNKSLLDKLKEELPGIETLCFDISDWQATKKAVESVLPIHLLVNNAGISVTKPFGTFDEADIDNVFNVNFKGAFNVSQVVANDLKKRGLPGAIVNMSSIASTRPLQEHAVYTTSKSALDGLTKTMALELGKHSIRVNSLHPTVTMTDMGREHWSDPAKSGPMLARTPLGRFAEVSDVVQATLFLLDDGASSYLTGVALPVDGGLMSV